MITKSTVADCGIFDKFKNNVFIAFDESYSGSLAILANPQVD